MVGGREKRGKGGEREEEDGGFSNCALNPRIYPEPAVIGFLGHHRSPSSRTLGEWSSGARVPAEKKRGGGGERAKRGWCFQLSSNSSDARETVR